MSRYRIIHCLIWNDDKFPFLPEDAKLVFFHLLTTPMSTPFGCYKAGIGALSEESRVEFKRYKEGFRILLREGLVEYDDNGLVLFLPCFLKYNPPANPNVLKSWGKIYSELPASPLKDKLYRCIEGICMDRSESFTKVFSKWLPIPYSEPFEEPLTIPCSSGIANQEQEQLITEDDEEVPY